MTTMRGLRQARAADLDELVTRAEAVFPGDSTKERLYRLALRSGQIFVEG